MTTLSASRRRFLQHSLTGAVGCLAIPRVHAANAQSAPSLPSGAAIGEVKSNEAILWTQTDRPAQLVVDWSTDAQFRSPGRVKTLEPGPTALGDADFTVKTMLRGLPAGQRIYYRASFVDLANPRLASDPVTGSFRTAPSNAAEPERDVSFVWSGDTAGQGFGIDESRGGMKTYETMRRLEPDFFVHCGDHIYADNPIPESIKLPDGEWRNLTTSATSKVAETLAEFRANYFYNLMDANVRRFNADVPMYAQWDDHETLNNWYPGERITDDRYQARHASVLAARAKKAFMQCLPVPDLQASLGLASSRIYRRIRYGPLLELFFLDMRTYRGPNSENRQAERSAASALLGAAQLRWLRAALANSRATWKVVCSDMPLGLIVRDGEHFENGANGSGPPLGRELEIADLLQSMKRRGVKNTVWVTADVHYAASHYYDPARARFKDFSPFWEFVSGPLHAGTFGPGELDDTFGPELKFKSIPDDMEPNRPPSEGLQFFGHVSIDRQTKAMKVSHYNVAGDLLWSIELDDQSV